MEQQMTTVDRAPYPLDNDDSYAFQHHQLLAALLDPITRRRLGETTRPEGALCLEVGAGGGSIARWLAAHVGRHGHITALDLKPHHIPANPAITVLAHDLNGDQPLPPGPFDIIHARLVLSHLPKRREILRRLADRLAPDGVLLIGDWRSTNPDPVVAAPTPEAADLYRRYQRTVGEHVFAEWGTDRDWAADAFLAMRETGLTDVHTTVDAEYWVGGGKGCHLIATLIHEVRAPLLAAGLTPADLATLSNLLDDPALVLHGHPLYYTSGRRGR
jgi:SAM-dependent methyltransferase